MSMREHGAGAACVAGGVGQQCAGRQGYYPGLRSHPGHEIARRQQSGFGGMVSFEVEGNEATVRSFIDSLQLFSLAESLGGVESLVCHPPSMTHAAVTPEALSAAGVGQNLIRLSVGLESAEDLIADVLQALDAAQARSKLEPVAVA